MTEKRNTTLNPSKRTGTAQMGRRQGGLKGGRARAEKLSPERRREIAVKATRARWAKKAGESLSPATGR